LFCKSFSLVYIFLTAALTSDRDIYLVSRLQVTWQPNSTPRNFAASPHNREFGTRQSCGGGWRRCRTSAEVRLTLAAGGCPERLRGGSADRASECHGWRRQPRAPTSGMNPIHSDLREPPENMYPMLPSASGTSQTVANDNLFTEMYAYNEHGLPSLMW
jgi:hypothetical protein